MRPGLGELSIREASPDDAARLLRIYAPFVTGTAVSFEAEVPTVEDFAARISASLEHWSWVVADSPSGLVGYAYGSQHRAREAYRWSAEVSAYLAPEARGQGVGQALYGELFGRLAGRGLRRAFAGVTLPNEASVRFHERAGFTIVGVFESVGWKFGAWHDVAWFQRWIVEAPPCPARATAGR